MLPASVKLMLLRSSHEQDPSFEDSFFEMNERGQRGGEREREIELRERFAEKGMEETRGDTMNTEERSNRCNQIFIQNILILFLTNFSFIEIQEEKLRRGVASRRSLLCSVDELTRPLHCFPLL